MKRRRKYHVGKRFGNWVVLEILFNDKGYLTGYLKCKCDCGTIKNVSTNSLVQGGTKSCGCLPVKYNLKHGKCYTPEYNAWRAMRSRCYAPYNNRYKLYSERGTQVCAGYKNSFENLLADIGNRPTPQHSVDRIKNHLHYSCGKCEECIQNGWKMNVRWATEEVQSRNKITNKWYEYNGIKMIQADWADELGVSKATLNKYLMKYSSIERAVLFYSKSKRKYKIKPKHPALSP